MTMRMMPHVGEPAEYLLIEGHLQEVNWYKERFRSWFVGDAVLEDGSMYLCTPVDPLFLALPLLESSRMQVTDSSQEIPCPTAHLSRCHPASDGHQNLLMGGAPDGTCSALADIVQAYHMK